MTFGTLGKPFGFPGKRSGSGWFARAHTHTHPFSLHLVPTRFLHRMGVFPSSTAFGCANGERNGLSFRYHVISAVAGLLKNTSVRGRVFVCVKVCARPLFLDGLESLPHVVTFLVKRKWYSLSSCTVCLLDDEFSSSRHTHSHTHAECVHNLP